MRKMVTLFHLIISFMSTTNSSHTDINLDHPPKFDDYLDIIEQEELIVHTSFDLIEQKELVDYEKKSFFLDYVEVQREQYENALLENFFIEELFYAIGVIKWTLLHKLENLKISGRELKEEPVPQTDVRLHAHHVRTSHTNPQAMIFNSARRH
ncbi:hypothetical protein WN944_028999 [Citrus x changshan-huyou]|uniref:Uncharacterized protein n=1 Tax=Citrus x changshan-huyou TaxID=2935761 RepID=A0AAP0LNT9_9ROSI